MIPAILLGGLIAGLLDLTCAFIIYGWGVPRAIASGLLGAAALQGGAGTWVLGVALHFVIALSAAAVYFALSRHFLFMKQHFLVCGVFYGVAIYLSMNLIVLPLSAVPFKIGPFTVGQLRQGLLIHMFAIGLPIAAGVRKFSQ